MIRLFCLQLGPLGSGTPFALASNRQHCTGVTQRKKGLCVKSEYHSTSKTRTCSWSRNGPVAPNLGQKIIQARVWPGSTKLSSIHLVRYLVKAYLGRWKKWHLLKKTLVGFKALHNFILNRLSQTGEFQNLTCARRTTRGKAFIFGRIDYCYCEKVGKFEFRLCNFLKINFRQL